ncbi:hypothetical protein HUJ05_011161 [Dendroctonus ponderosae]|nr:hypothetical protein HUJ05_011161 [Dendroctonus ponderosae]
MEGALGCWLSATRTPEGGWQLQWQAGDGKEGDFVALCPLGSASASECVARQPVKGAERSAMWLLDAPDCEQLLCFRYYDAETDTCLAESEALRPAPECNGIENGAFRDDAPPGANGAKRKEATALYNRHPTLKHMLNRIRRDPAYFDKYQHNKELVALVNMFANEQLELPDGWDRKQDAVAKPFFIDHTNKRTTYMDPRLPLDCAQAVRRLSDDAEAPVPPPRPTTTTANAQTNIPEVPAAYNDKVVAFLRQPNIFDILKERHAPVGSSATLRDKINAVRVDGTLALDRLSHDVNLTILLR